MIRHNLRTLAQHRYEAGKQALPLFVFEGEIHVTIEKLKKDQDFDVLVDKVMEHI